MRLVVDKMPGNAAKCRFRHLDKQGFPVCSIRPILESCTFQDGKCNCLVPFAELLDREQKEEKTDEGRYVYKTFIEQIKDGKYLGETCLVDEFENKEKAVEAGKECRFYPESKIRVRIYDRNKKVNIMSDNEQDTGEIVYSEG